MPEKLSFGEIVSKNKEVVLLLFGVILVCLLFGSIIYIFQGFSVSTALPVISVLGIISLLLCLAGISYVFVKIDIHDKSQALGLPPGSIQSVIALSLIVLFAILSVFVFSSMGDSGLRRLSNLTAAERDAQISKISSGFSGWQQETNGTFSIYVRDPSVDSRNEVGKQLILLIGTLMTSAVSFYFGSRATAAGAAAVNVDGLSKPQSGQPKTETSK